MEIFWRLLFGHLLADFTFQTDFINRWKRESFTGLLVHCGMHPAFYVVLCWPFLGGFWIHNSLIRLNGWTCVAIIFISHLLEDWWRVYSIEKYRMPDNTVFFFWDQIIHYSVIFAVAPMASATTEVLGLFPEKWPVLGCLFALTTHATTVVIYFIEKDLRGAEFPAFQEKYLAMGYRLILSMCFLLPGWPFVAAAAGVWIATLGFLRRRRMFDLTSLTFYGGAALAALCGLAARSVYYS